MGQIIFLKSTSCWDKCSSEGLDPDQAAWLGGPFRIFFCVAAPTAIWTAFSPLPFCLQEFSCLSLALCAKLDGNASTWLLWAGFYSLPSLPNSHSNQLTFFFKTEKLIPKGKFWSARFSFWVHHLPLVLTLSPIACPWKNMRILILSLASVVSTLCWGPCTAGREHLPPDMTCTFIYYYFNLSGRRNNISWLFLPHATTHFRIQFSFDWNCSYEGVEQRLHLLCSCVSLTAQRVPLLMPAAATMANTVFFQNSMSDESYQNTCFARCNS